MSDCFSKVPRTFRARTGNCQTSIWLSSKGDLLTCFYCKKNQQSFSFDGLETRRRKDIMGIVATRNRPERFFWTFERQWPVSRKSRKRFGP